jgi:DNA adenine methylase
MLKAPFPWFGGKSKAAPLIWSRLGDDCGNYVEPFFGSGAIWHNRPAAFAGWSVVNDLDCYIVNVWRAMKADPEAVAENCDWPVTEADLSARHLWLVTHREAMVGRIQADPEYFDARAAAWWVWGCCAWIGSGWCDGSGPWVAGEDGGLALGHAGQGVNRKLPHLGDAGKGVNRKLPHLGDAGKGEWLAEWFGKLSASLRDTRITCGGWERIMSPGTMTRNGPAAVVLDPPYSQTEAVYAHDGAAISGEVRAWCMAKGADTRLRIALCGHVGEHEALEGEGWAVATWGKGGGYQGADDRERIWFSPGCKKPEAEFEF